MVITGNHTYEERTRRLLSESLDEFNGITDKKRQLERELYILNRQIKAYETVLEIVSN